MKKVIALLIACFLVVPTLTACAPPNNGNQCQDDEDDD